MPFNAQDRNKLVLNLGGRQQRLDQVLCQDGQKMGKPDTNQCIMWWNYNSHHAGERSEMTPAALSIRCGEKKYKQGLLLFMIFYVAELFVAGKYCSCQRETPREMKS